MSNLNQLPLLSNVARKTGFGLTLAIVFARTSRLLTQRSGLLTVALSIVTAKVKHIPRFHMRG
jgi:hypothetical protein